MSAVRSLSDDVLLAMLFGQDVAHQLREQSLSLTELFELAPYGNAVRESEAAYLARPVAAAAKELLARALLASMKHREVLSSPEQVRSYLRLTIGAREHEVFVMLCLDAQNRLIEAHELFRGTLTQTSVYPREVVKVALQANAATVIFAHNHPSGIAEASRADQALTTALKAALTLVDIKVLDHFVIGSGPAYSFAEHGLL